MAQVGCRVVKVFAPSGLELQQAGFRNLLKVRYLVISDIHGNYEALQAALEAAPFDRVLCLGDLVGYGAKPE